MQPSSQLNSEQNADFIYPIYYRVSLELNSQLDSNPWPSTFVIKVQEFTTIFSFVKFWFWVPYWLCQCCKPIKPNSSNPHYWTEPSLTLNRSNDCLQFGVRSFRQLAFLQLVILSTCHFINLFCHPSHFDNLPFCQPHIFLFAFYQFAFFQLVILSTCHSKSLPFCQNSILSSFHFDNIPLCQLGFFSTWRFINLQKW